MQHSKYSMYNQIKIITRSCSVLSAHPYINGIWYTSPPSDPAHTHRLRWTSWRSSRLNHFPSLMLSMYRRSERNHPCEGEDTERYAKYDTDDPVCVQCVEFGRISLGTMNMRNRNGSNRSQRPTGGP